MKPSSDSTWYPQSSCIYIINLVGFHDILIPFYGFSMLVEGYLLTRTRLEDWHIRAEKEALVIRRAQLVRLSELVADHNYSASLSERSAILMSID